MVNNRQAPTKTPRLFYMSSITTAGQRFEVKEILCPYRSVHVPNMMPFRQADLYVDEQPGKRNLFPLQVASKYKAMHFPIDFRVLSSCTIPRAHSGYASHSIILFAALFLLDAGNKLWLWQGWWPENDSKSNADNFSENNPMNNITGSGLIRWHAERRAAMQTAVDYRRLLYGTLRRDKQPAAELVWAGAEPLEFTNLFPAWKHDDKVELLNMKVRVLKSTRIVRSVIDVLFFPKFVKDSSLDRTLSALSRSTYSWEELQQRPLPDGVDPAKLEKYLSDEEFEVRRNVAMELQSILCLIILMLYILIFSSFQKHLGLTRAEFASAQRWKQIEIRKEKGLF